MLVLRDLGRGITRFDQLRASLAIAPNILSSRLSSLAEEGLLEKRAYSERPKRYEYILTEAGRDFIPVLAAIGTWGQKHRADGGELAHLVDAETGVAIEPQVIDRVSGAPIGTRPLRFTLSG